MKDGCLKLVRQVTSKVSDVLRANCPLQHRLHSPLMRTIGDVADEVHDRVRHTIGAGKLATLTKENR